MKQQNNNTISFYPARINAKGDIKLFPCVDNDKGIKKIKVIYL